MEVDKTCIGERREGMPKVERKSPTMRNGTGKPVVAVARNRKAIRLGAAAMTKNGKPTLQRLIVERANDGANACTGGLGTRSKVPLHREAAGKGASQHVRLQARFSGGKSLRANPMRIYQDTFHRIGLKHLGLHALKSAMQSKVRDAYAANHMVPVASCIVGKRILRGDLTADSRLSSETSE